MIWLGLEHPRWPGETKMGDGEEEAMFKQVSKFEGMDCAYGIDH